MQKALILRYGEIFLKGSNRRFFIDRMTENIKQALIPFPGVVFKKVHGRYIIIPDENNEKEVTEALKKVFGLTSISPSYIVEQTIEAAGEAAVKLLKEVNAKGSFKIKAKRSNKSFPLTSPEIGRDVGSIVYEHLKLDIDLTNPDHTVEVEFGPEISFVSSYRINTAGGLPVGVSGHMQLLLSAGIDSPVAAWMMMKRGATLSALTFYSPPYAGEEGRTKVIKLCEKLQPWGGPRELHVVKFGEVQKTLRKQKPDKLAVILYRRMMMRVANIMAVKNKAKAIVTGESLGQVASQTIENMTVTEAVADIPVMKPLIAFDKTETIEIARKIGTFEISILPYQSACALFLPKHPETKAKLKYVLRAEEGLPVDDIALELANNAEHIKFR